MVTGCISDGGLQYAVEPHTALVSCPSLFYVECHRWPSSREELVEWAKHNRAKFPNERYSLVGFQEQKDGSLLIHYETTDKGGGTVQLSRPKAETH